MKKQNQPQHRWTIEEEAQLTKKYPHTSTKNLAEFFGVTTRVVYAKARVMKLNKTDKYMTENNIGRKSDT